MFSGTQQRVLGLLFGQPERSFYVTEVIRLAGSGSGTVQRELRRLANSGLVNITRVGNQTHYQANAASPVFNELRGIVDKTVGVADVVRTALEPLTQRIVFATLYGSVAKHVDSASSDIDVLVVSNELRLEDLYKALETAERRLGRSISPTLLTVAEYRRRRDTVAPFLDRVLAGGHIVLAGSENAATAA